MAHRMQLSVLITAGRACFSALPPTASMGQAVADMVRQKKTAVAVLDGGRLKGIVTRTDVLRSWGGGQAPEQEPLSRFMTRDLVVAGPDASFQHALESMAASDIEHLPVVQDGRLLTVVHQSDLLERHIGDLHEEIRHLQEYIEGLHNAEKD
jgi:signal-transduction protein with cAMP-binding, CBS, and nucleotidyltransferase domain